MIFNVYSIKDSKVGYLTPTFEVNDQVAMRNFAHAVKNSESILNSHPNDFSLYCIGEFDSISGLISCGEKHFLCEASDCL